MKKHIYSILLSTLVYFSTFINVHADEGMWLPFLLNRNFEEMTKLGLKLTPEEIYNINKSSLKDAIINFGGFCSGSIISKDGLIITNHHCGYDAVQSHSTVEKNYLKNGFWALNHSQELPNPGLTATFLVRIEDVTQKVLSAILNTTLAERDTKFVAITKKLIAEATKGTDYSAEIKDMFAGNEYYLLVFETFRDIRLVGAPPEAIGKFGGDTDNWMWPRHTGDFSMFRCYTAPNGKPADFSINNIPLKPKYYLPVSVKGVQSKDFSMIMGYPGRTDRYKTSSGIKLLLEQSNPTRIKIRSKILKIMKYDMDQNEEVKLKLSSHYASVSNYHKNFIGQNKGLVRMQTIDVKKAQEQIFQIWADGSPDRKNKYGNVLSDISSAHEMLKGYFMARDYLNELLFSAGGMLQMPYIVWDIYKMLKRDNPNMDSLKIITEIAKVKINKYFKDYNLATDKKIFIEVLKMFYEDCPKESQPKIFELIEKKYDKNFNAFADDVFNKSIFVSKDKLLKFFENPSIKHLDKDIGFETMQSVMIFYYEKILPGSKILRDKLSDAIRLYIAGIREMNPGKLFYPDANFTMRLTYGKVIDYDPKDAVHYDYATTLDGLIEKFDPYDEEFQVPDKLIELYKKKDFGQYAAPDGKIYVCFITDNDITGGNSGSAAMNDKGELIGLAFDNNWEGMTGDLVYDPSLKRCINVDIRYVLFIIDKYAGAKNLIDEMTLMR